MSTVERRGCGTRRFISSVRAYWRFIIPPVDSGAIPTLEALGFHSC
jgi:hypothetical protein